MDPVTEGRLLPSHQRLCLGCGTDHPSGLGIALRGAGTRVTGSFVVGDHHEGAPGLAHGGIVATALDEAMAGLLWLLRQPAVTARLEVDYNRPIPTGSRVDLDAGLDRREGRKIFVRATARIGDERRDGDEVIRIGRVAKPEREGEQEDHEHAVAGRMAADEAVDTSHWTIH